MKVQVENYVPGKLKELGLDYATCHALNPKLIYASITGSFTSCHHYSLLPSSLIPLILTRMKGTVKRVLTRVDQDTTS